MTLRTEITPLTLNRRELQKALGWSRERVLAAIKHGILPNVGSQRRILVPKSAVQKFLDAQ